MSPSEVKDAVAEVLTDGRWHALEAMVIDLGVTAEQMEMAVAKLVEEGLAYQGPRGSSRNAVQLRSLADRRVVPIVQLLSRRRGTWIEVAQLAVSGLTVGEAVETAEALGRVHVVDLDRPASGSVLVRLHEEQLDSGVGELRATAPGTEDS